MKPSRSERGVATLELVMCMPIILALMVGIVWLGYSVIGQSEVTIEARHKAWKERFDGSGGKPLFFLADDFKTEEATTEVKISPMFDDVSPPESSHDIAAGTWDHQAVDMNRAPNWEHYLTAAVNAKTGGMQVAYSGADNFLNELKNIGADAIRDQVEKIFSDFLDNPFSGFTGEANSGKDENDQKTREERARLTEKIAAVRTEIDEVNEHVKEIEKELDEAEDKDEKAIIEVKLEVTKNKLKRLKSELKWLEQDLKAID